MPDVVGDSEDAARSKLDGAGLTVNASEEESADADPGTVLRQDPAAGTKLDKGGAVAIVVATAPPEASVPDVNDQFTADAPARRSGRRASRSASAGGTPRSPRRRAS